MGLAGGYVEEDDGSRTGSALAVDKEDHTMAGYVRAHVQINPVCLSEVIPVSCPAADEHTAGQQRCWVELPGHSVRACLYYISTCENDNCTARAHPSKFLEIAVSRNMRQIRCGVLCQRQRGNRPPGC